MEFSKLEQEEAWADAWNELYDLLENSPGAVVLLPGYCEVSLERAQEWIQNRAYESRRIAFRTCWFKGSKAICVEEVPK